MPNETKRLKVVDVQIPTYQNTKNFLETRKKEKKNSFIAKNEDSESHTIARPMNNLHL